MNQKTLIDQQKAAGTYNKSFQQAYDSVYPENTLEVKSFDPLQLDIFTSPWAVNKEAEAFFNETIIKLGDIVKDDIKLGTLYVTLILVTPGVELSEKTKVSH